MTAPHSISSDAAELIRELRGHVSSEQPTGALLERAADEIERLRTLALPSGEVERETPHSNIVGHGPFHHVTQNEKDMCETCNPTAASSPTPQIAEDVSALASRLEAECNVRDNHPDDYCHDLTKMFRECVAALRAPTPAFSRWADTIEAASLAISPKGSKELEALAAEVRAYDVSKL